MQQSSSKREVYNNAILLEDTRKYKIDNLTLHLNQLIKEQQQQQQKAKNSKWK